MLLNNQFILTTSKSKSDWSKIGDTCARFDLFLCIYWLLIFPTATFVFTKNSFISVYKPRIKNSKSKAAPQNANII